MDKVQRNLQILELLFGSSNISYIEETDSYILRAFFFDTFTAAKLANDPQIELKKIVPENNLVEAHFKVI